jgi:hypothetical protein
MRIGVWRFSEIDKPWGSNISIVAGDVQVQAIDLNFHACGAMALS